ncbi:TPA: Tn3 family transposase, partial [Legionella pneumophila subsp. pneumophila]|nr:Tn3 family transposase [Legionella pneumophila subsp. pneumophila]
FSIKSIDNYTGIIRPSGVIDKSLIKAEERGILRVLLSLLLQENTQSIIVKKINSSARYGRLKKALFEYNKILKSTHVLNLIDNMALRKAIRAARNRTEAYHQLQGLKNISNPDVNTAIIIFTRLSISFPNLLNFGGL